MDDFNLGDFFSLGEYAPTESFVDPAIQGFSSQAETPFDWDSILGMSDSAPGTYTGSIPDSMWSSDTKMSWLDKLIGLAQQNQEHGQSKNPFVQQGQQKISPLASLLGAGWGAATSIDDYLSRKKLYNQQMQRAQEDRDYAMGLRAQNAAMNSPFDTTITPRNYVAIDPALAAKYGKLNKSTGSVYAPSMYDKSTPTVTINPRAINAGANVLNKAKGGAIPGEGQCACGGLGLMKGGTTGQSDKVPANLSHGEYVMDADVVSALGDGNTDAGAAKLDQMREAVRGHKRSASPKSIPPKAKSPLEYMKKGAK